jgi:hypothetical protein
VEKALAADPQYWKKLAPPASLAPKDIPAEQLQDVPFDLLPPEVIRYAFPKGVRSRSKLCRSSSKMKFGLRKEPPKIPPASTWRGWEKGELQIHLIYTGVGESMFWIFPDGTTMLLDCGAIDTTGREPAPILPDASRHAGGLDRALCDPGQSRGGQDPGSTS